jgi:hypothetical protein
MMIGHRQYWKGTVNHGDTDTDVVVEVVAGDNILLVSSNDAPIDIHVAVRTSMMPTLVVTTMIGKLQRKEFVVAVAASALVAHICHMIERMQVDDIHLHGIKPSGTVDVDDVDVAQVRSWNDTADRMAWIVLGRIAAAVADADSAVGTDVTAHSNFVVSQKRIVVVVVDAER